MEVRHDKKENRCVNVKKTVKLKERERFKGWSYVKKQEMWGRDGEVGTGGVDVEKGNGNSRDKSEVWVYDENWQD